MGEGYKNPALRRENGVLTSYCVDCGALIGTEHTMNWHSLIRKQYCRYCADTRRMECDRLRHQRHRQGIRSERKEMRTHADLLRQENKLLRQMVVMLRNDVEQMKKQR